MSVIADALRRAECDDPSGRQESQRLSGVTHQPSVISRQPSAVSRQPSAVFRPTSASALALSAVAAIVLVALPAVDESGQRNVIASRSMNPIDALSFAAPDHHAPRTANGVPAMSLEPRADPSPDTEAQARDVNHRARLRAAPEPRASSRAEPGVSTRRLIASDDLHLERESPAAAMIDSTAPADVTRPYRLSGVLRGDEGLWAVVNGAVVRAGDTVDGAEVVALDTTGARLRAGEREFRLHLTRESNHRNEP